LDRRLIRCEHKESPVTVTLHDHALTTDQLAEFEERGFVILRDVVPVEVRDGLQGVFEAVVEDLARSWYDEGKITDTYDDLPFRTRFAALRAQLPARFPTSWRKALVSEEVYQLWQRPELLGPIRSLVGDEVYAHGVWNGRPREPYTAIQRILWHQDAHYYKGWDDADGDLISMWIPLVSVNAESGCLQRLGYLPLIRGFNGLFTVADDLIDESKVFTAEMEPGDALLFGDVTLHQGLPNEADFVRWSIDIRFGTASPEIISKTPRGYYCYSATDPSRVETFDAWKARYDYSDVGLEAELENFDEAAATDLDEVARQMGVSRSELEVF
jgi:phytanoyl-CoA hydroxylase